jgi:hypothetical protein
MTSKREKNCYLRLLKEFAQLAVENKKLKHRAIEDQGTLKMLEQEMSRLHHEINLLRNSP